MRQETRSLIRGRNELRAVPAVSLSVGHFTCLVLISETLREGNRKNCADSVGLHTQIYDVAVLEKIPMIGKKMFSIEHQLRAHFFVRSGPIVSVFGIELTKLSLLTCLPVIEAAMRRARRS
jgi:hypothetical protein